LGFTTSPHQTRRQELHDSKGVLSAVITGGLTAYVQAGDIRIYKSFNHKFSQLIIEWKL